MITNNLAYRRKERMVTQIELAKALKVTRQTIIAIENNLNIAEFLLFATAFLVAVFGSLILKYRKQKNPE